MDEHYVTLAIAGLEFAADVAKQLITLATGVIALTVTFTRDLVARASRWAMICLRTSWVFYSLSVLFGIISLMAITGELAPVDLATRDLVMEANVRIPAIMQISSFLVATAAVITFGFKAVIDPNK